MVVSVTLVCARVSLFSIGDTSPPASSRMMRRRSARVAGCRHGAADGYGASRRRRSPGRRATRVRRRVPVRDRRQGGTHFKPQGAGTSPSRPVQLAVCLTRIALPQDVGARPRSPAPPPAPGAHAFHPARDADPGPCSRPGARLGGRASLIRRAPRGPAPPRRGAQARKVVARASNRLILDPQEPWSYRSLRSWEPRVDGALLIGNPMSPLVYAAACVRETRPSAGARMGADQPSSGPHLSQLRAGRHRRCAAP
jgi:hypothetical protein